MKPTLLQNIRNKIEAVNREQERAWQNELRSLKLEHIKRSTPSAFEASGGYSMKVKPYEDRTTNGLTRCILDFLNYSGHWAVRVNVQGQARIKKIPKYNIFSGRIDHHEKVTYTKSMTAKGTPDINSVIFGRSAQIEVKAGADCIRDDQAEQGNRIEAAGGLYLIATSMIEFLKWYKENFYDKG